MSIKVTVNAPAKNRISINSAKRDTIRTVGIAAPITVDNLTLESLQDVDATDADNNEVLVYDEASDKYVVKVLPNINGGSF